MTEKQGKKNITQKKSARRRVSKTKNEVAKAAPDSGSLRDLVIVESPAKARTLSRMLGDKYHVEASMGHVRDLPSNDLGIDMPAGSDEGEIRIDRLH